jgi:hypothetical protein
MDDRNLDPLLNERRDAPLPSLPPNFQDTVWREIRRRKAEIGECEQSWFGWLFLPLFRPGMALSGLALAVFLGVGLGMVSSDSRHSQARLALDLEVFGSSSPALPSTLMGYTK